MALALSADLRRRIVAAVDNGMSCRAAAVRLGIAPSTAIKWPQQWRRTGTIEAQRRGGDKRSHRLESHATVILALIAETPDVTLVEIVAHLQQQHGGAQHGLAAARSSRFRLQPKRRTPPRSCGLTSGSGGWPGSRPSPSWRPGASSSLHRRLATFLPEIESGAF
jgi:transposase